MRWLARGGWLARGLRALLISGVSARRSNSGAARGSDGGGRPSEPLALEQVVGQGVPGENDERLGAAAHGELHQAPLPEPGVDALVDRALAIGGLAGLAL